jgi:hypothetical protein
MYSVLLTAIALWISANFELPATFPLPNVKLVSAQEISFLRYGAFTSVQRGEIANQEQQTSGVLNRRQPVAVYDDLNETIFLPDNWKGDTPAELSVLVHEMVHHLQKKNHLNYECHGAREELAYKVQEKWLSLFGRDLASEFQIDPFTLKVSTTCGF